MRTPLAAVLASILLSFVCATAQAEEKKPGFFEKLGRALRPDVTIIKDGRTTYTARRSTTDESWEIREYGTNGRRPHYNSDRGYGARTTTLTTGVYERTDVRSRTNGPNGVESTIYRETRVGARAEVSGRIVVKSGMHNRDFLKWRERDILKKRGIKPKKK